MPVRLLVCYTGRTDWQNVEKDAPWERGPIRELLHQVEGGADRFDAIHVLYFVKSEPDISCRRAFEEKLRAEFPGRSGRIEFHAVDLVSPIDHGSIVRETRRLLDRLEREHGGAVEWHFHLSPGTPAMSTVLAVLGRTLYPAILYQTSRESREVSEVAIPHDMNAWTLERLAVSAQAPPSLEAFAGIHHDGDPMRSIIREAAVVARHPSIPVVILGETGTGKERFARAIHDASPLRNRRCIIFNAAAIPVELAEAEIFGHEKGAFTGALARREGLVRQADGGTLFIDEFAELPLNLQAKLLRFLNDGRYRLVGGAGEELTASCRIVVATNGDPYELIRAGRLRADLYHRVNGFTIRLPPLRARNKDVIVLAEALTRDLNREFRRYDPGWRDRYLSPEAKRFLRSYGWPGNVRELAATLRRAFVFAGNPEVGHADLERHVERRLGEAGGHPLFPELAPGVVVDLGALKADYERHYKRWALEVCEGNQAKAARMLSLTKLNPEGKRRKA